MEELEDKVKKISQKVKRKEEKKIRSVQMIQQLNQEF